MNLKLRRSLANFACRVLEATLPPALRTWGRAISSETASIRDDGEAFAFALGSLASLLPRLIASQFCQSFSALFETDQHSGGSVSMKHFSQSALHPRNVGIACAIGAVTLGLVYMAMAGAPAARLAINLAALIIGLAIFVLASRTTNAPMGWSIAVQLAIVAAILAPLLLGQRVEGAARWLSLGSFSVQPSLVLLPVMVVAFSRTQGPMSSVCIMAVAIAIALQPDRAVAAMLSAGLAVLFVRRPDKRVAAALGASIVAWIATLVQEDRLPAVPYVDQILYTAFNINAIAGAAVLCGSALLVVPALVGWYHDPADRATYAVFGAVWSAAVIAAALGNYPTPIVGYGASAIIGYVLSLAALPKRGITQSSAQTQIRCGADTQSCDDHLQLELA